MAMQQQGATAPPDKAKQQTLVGLPGDALRAMLAGNYEHGHPGLPPKDYEAPKEKRR